MQNNPHKQDIIQELRGKRRDIPDEPRIVPGVVTDCICLNVRKQPDIHADVAVVIDALTNVCVDLNTSTEDFYRVTTSDGVGGYCMKKYISLSK